LLFASSLALLKFTPPAQLNVFDFLFNRGGMPLTIPLGRSAPFALCFMLFTLCSLRYAPCPMRSALFISWVAIQYCFFRFFSLLNGLSFNSMQLSPLA